MRFIKPKEWVTPPGQAAMDDCCPPLAFIGRACQVLTYPIDAVVSGVVSVAICATTTRKAHRSLRRSCG